MIFFISIFVSGLPVFLIESIGWLDKNVVLYKNIFWYKIPTFLFMSKKSLNSEFIKSGLLSILNWVKSIPFFETMDKSDTDSNFFFCHSWDDKVKMFSSWTKVVVIFWGGFPISTVVYKLTTKYSFINNLSRFWINIL